MSATDPRADSTRAPLDVVPRAPDTSTSNGAASSAGNRTHVAAANGTPVAPGVSATSATASPASATCANCGGPLAPDQRYCLACGQPASPVRLAFLDVLQGEYQVPSQGIGIPGGLPATAYYAPPPEPDGLLGSLRRYSGLLALLGVLLASLLIGLLVGHWITGGNDGAGSGKQVIEVKGLSGALAAAPAPATSTGSSGSAAGASSAGNGSHSHNSAKQEAKEEAKDVKEVKAAKAPPVVHKKTSAQSLQTLNKTTGKQHAKEVNSLIKGDEPIETGH